MEQPKTTLVQKAEVLHLIDLIDVKMNVLGSRMFSKPTFETE